MPRLTTSSLLAKSRPTSRTSLYDPQITHFFGTRIADDRHFENAGAGLAGQLDRHVVGHVRTPKPMMAMYCVPWPSDRSPCAGSPSDVLTVTLSFLCSTTLGSVAPTDGVERERYQRTINFHLVEAAKFTAPEVARIGPLVRKTQTTT